MNMSMMEIAIKYAEMGLAVFPVRQNKAPFTPHGCKDAKTDLRAIKSWWKRWPDANIGIATGSASGGIVVIDIDIDEDKGVYGDESLREWEKENGELPETWRAITGRGGYHIYYRSDEKIKNTTNLYPGIDIRGEGGYVVAPPSIHQNGNYYQWEIDPDDTDIHFADQQVMEFIKGNNNGESHKEKFKLPDRIKSGERNDTLFRYGCSLQAKGYSDEEILNKLEDANTRCDVPLKDEELTTIYNSVIEKEKGIRRVHFETDLPEGWHYPNIDKSEDGKVFQTIHNAKEAIEYDQYLFNKIRMNKLAYAPYVFGDLPWSVSKNEVREWNNVDDANLKMYLEKHYGLRPSEKIMDALTIVADKHEYNPVTDILEQCYHQWDGQKHIENLLPDYLGVEESRYTTEVMKLFMLGAITRAYNPGCKFDYVPIIYGTQGCGKSTFCRALAMDDSWYDDNFNTIEGDKAAEKLRGLWMAELAELLATKKAKELESIKSFLTSRADNYRPPYNRRTESRKRVCVFIGTTNSDHFLTDRTGNRRFLPLIANKDNAKYSITDSDNYNKALIDIRNAWGEAMDIIKKAGKWLPLVLSEDLNEDVARMQRRFQEDDPQVGMIQSYLDTCGSERVCVLELWEKALQNSGKPQKYESNLLHTIMQQEIEGWTRAEKRQRCGDYGLQICYEKEDKYVHEEDIGDLPFS